MCSQVGTIGQVVGNLLSTDNGGLGKRNSSTQPATGLFYHLREVVASGVDDSSAKAIIS